MYKFLFLTAFWLIQQQVTVPPQQVTVPGQTITLPAPSLPTGMSFDGTTLTVPAVSAGKVTLTGGTAYQDGSYLVTFKGGAISYSPYVPPAASAAVAAYPDIPVSFAANAAGVAAGSAIAQTFPIPAGETVNDMRATWITGPYTAGNVLYNYDLGVAVKTAPTATAAGLGVVYIKNNSYSQKVPLPASVVKVRISQ